MALAQPNIPLQNLIEECREIQPAIGQAISNVRYTWFIDYHANSLVKRYHMIQYNVETHFRECKRFAHIFSQYPHILLGDHRQEVQFDDLNITMTLDEWVKFEDLPNGHLLFEVQYYIHTENFFPSVIFFRISKEVEEYEEKLSFVINQLLGIEAIEYQEPDVPAIDFPENNFPEIIQANPYQMKQLTFRSYPEQNHFFHLIRMPWTKEMKILAIFFFLVSGIAIGDRLLTGGNQEDQEGLDVEDSDLEDITDIQNPSNQTIQNSQRIIVIE